MNVSMPEGREAERIAMPQRIAVAITFVLIALSSGSAYAADSASQPQCPEPWVPSKEVAKAIYLAVGRAQNTPWFKNYPVVVVEDAGDHWSVSQASGKPLPKLKPGEVIVSAGGGQLSMDIDKCTGAISHDAMNR
jgi:hypothetical protein